MDVYLYKRAKKKSKGRLQNESMSLFVWTALNVPKQIFISWDKRIKRKFSAYISTPYTHPHKQKACGKTYYSCQKPLSPVSVFSDLAPGHLPCCSTAEMPTSQKHTNFCCNISQLWNDLKFVKSLPSYRALRKLVFHWSLQPHSQACSRAVPSILSWDVDEGEFLCVKLQIIA